MLRKQSSEIEQLKERMSMTLNFNIRLKDGARNYHLHRYNMRNEHHRLKRPDHHQNLITSLLDLGPPFHKFRLKSVHIFLDVFQQTD